MIHIGTTEGRFRMIMPDLIAEMGRIHPEEVVDGRMADAVTLREQLMKGALDLAFSGLTPKTPEVIKRELILDEKLYYVISEESARRQGSRPPGSGLCTCYAFSAASSLYADFGRGAGRAKDLPQLHSCLSTL